MSVVLLAKCCWLMHIPIGSWKQIFTWWNLNHQWEAEHNYPVRKPRPSPPTLLKKLSCLLYPRSVGWRGDFVKMWPLLVGWRFVVCSGVWLPVLVTLSGWNEPSVSLPSLIFWDKALWDGLLPLEISLSLCCVLLSFLTRSLCLLIYLHIPIRFFSFHLSFCLIHDCHSFIQ